VSIRYTARLAEAGIEPSVGSVGDSSDSALAERVIGLFKTEASTDAVRDAASRRWNSPRSTSFGSTCCNTS
jgi:transposase InsO family protein